MTSPLDQFREAGVIVTDFFDMMCGEHLGSGVSRDVFVMRHDPRCVIKIEVRNAAGSDKHWDFQNIMEWKMWQAMGNTDESKWLAPCLGISDNGRVLIQRRTRPLTAALAPKKIPRWCHDTDARNWGLIKGVPVMHDYGLSCALINATGRGLKPHKWDFR